MNGYTIAALILVVFFSYGYYSEVILAEGRAVDPVYQAERRAERASYFGENMEYIKDTSTNLCFARMTSGHQISIATVDCGMLAGIQVFEFATVSR